MPILTTATEVGIKEDVSDIISNISPTATPFLSSIGTEKVHNITVSWLTDQLDAVGLNAQAEGFTAVSETINPPTLQSNITQILSKVIAASGTEDAVSLYGRDSASAYNMAKAGKAIKRDLENSLVGTKQTIVTSVTGRQMNGAQAQVAPAGIFIAGGANAASNTPIAENDLLNALEYCYVNGAEPTKVLVTPDDSRVVASFTDAAGRYRVINDNSKKITNAVTLYASSFGDVSVVIDRFIAAGDTLVYDPEQWKLLVLRNWFREVLGKTGDSLQQMIVGEFSLKHANPIASAVIRRHS